MHNDRLAVLLPSRFRPAGLRRAYESWRTHSVASDIVFGFQEGDATLDENLAIAAGHPHHLFSNIGLAAKANALCEAMPGYAGYMILNDDHVIQTPGWDRKLLDVIDENAREHGHRIVIPHWRDGIHDERLAQGFVTAELLAVTGTYLPRGYMRHLFTDNYFMTIGQVCGILRYVGEVFIEHLHFHNGKAALDANYAETQNNEAYQREEVAFRRWLNEAGLPTTTAILSAIVAATDRPVR